MFCLCSILATHMSDLMSKCSGFPSTERLTLKFKVEAHSTSMCLVCVAYSTNTNQTQGTFLVAQLVKKLPVMQKTRVQSLGWEDLLEKRMAAHSSILAWKISWTEEPDSLQSRGSQRVRHDLATDTNTCSKTNPAQLWARQPLNMG